MYTDRVPWTQAVLLLYFAKRRAESAPGAGADTDIYWIKPDGYGYIEPQASLMGALANVHRDRDRRMQRAVQAGLSGCAVLSRAYRSRSIGGTEC